MQTKRLFLGITIPPVLTAKLVEFQKQHSHVLPIRWVPEQNLHITILFIGDYTVNKIESLIQTIETMTSNMPSFNITFHEFCLAPKRKPYMIWARFNKNEQFNSLVNALSNIINLKKTHPIPHITLARFNPLKITPILKQSDLKASFSVDTFYLYESILKPDGAQYKIMKNFTLKTV